MEHMQLDQTEDRRTTKQKDESRSSEAQPLKAQGTVSRPEVPCSCPGCFPFDC